MNRGYVIRDPEGVLSCFTTNAEDSIKWHVAGYEAFRDGRAVDVARINKGWWPQVEKDWSCVEAVLMEASEHVAIVHEAAMLTEEWKSRLETIGTMGPGAMEATGAADPETITADQVGSLEDVLGGTLGGGQPGDPVDAEFDPTDIEEEDEEAAAAKEAEREIENR